MCLLSTQPRLAAGHCQEERWHKLVYKARSQMISHLDKRGNVIQSYPTQNILITSEFSSPSPAAEAEPSRPKRDRSSMSVYRRAQLQSTAGRVPTFKFISFARQRPPPPLIQRAEMSSRLATGEATPPPLTKTEERRTEGGPRRRPDRAQDG